MKPVDRPAGAAERLDRAEPHAHLAPVVVGRDVDRADVVLDLAAPAVDRRPVGVAQQHGPRIDDPAHRGDVAQAHVAVGLERHDRADFGAEPALRSGRRPGPTRSARRRRSGSPRPAGHKARIGGKAATRSTRLPARRPPTHRRSRSSYRPKLASSPASSARAPASPLQEIAPSCGQNLPDCG